MYKSDPCYKFAWALDASVRQAYLDNRLAKEIETAFDQLANPNAYGCVSEPAAGGLGGLTEHESVDVDPSGRRRSPARRLAPAATLP